MEDLLAALKDLQHEFASMAEYQDPDAHLLVEDPQGLELLTVLMLVYGLQDGFLSL